MSSMTSGSLFVQPPDFILESLLQARTGARRRTLSERAVSEVPPRGGTGAGAGAPCNVWRGVEPMAALALIILNYTLSPA